MSAVPETMFLFDVDNTLFDNDALQAELRRHLTQALGPVLCERYWALFEELRADLGYVDYLGALQGLRREIMHDPRVLDAALWLLNFDFQGLLYPDALAAVAHVSAWGRTGILSDGDAVFQPHKIARAGLRDAVEARVLIYVHKEDELSEVERQYPAEHYVLIDDKIRILDAVKQSWGAKVTTVFPRQGHYAHDPREIAAHPAADVTIERIGDLLKLDRTAFRPR